MGASVSTRTIFISTHTISVGTRAFSVGTHTISVGTRAFSVGTRAFSVRTRALLGLSGAFQVSVHSVGYCLAKIQDLLPYLLYSM